MAPSPWTPSSKSPFSVGSLADSLVRRPNKRANAIQPHSVAHITQPLECVCVCVHVVCFVERNNVLFHFRPPDSALDRLDFLAHQHGRLEQSVSTAPSALEVPWLGPRTRAHRGGFIILGIILFAQQLVKLSSAKGLADQPYLDRSGRGVPPTGSWCTAEYTTKC